MDDFMKINLYEDGSISIKKIISSKGNPIIYLIWGNCKIFTFTLFLYLDNKKGLEHCNALFRDESMNRILFLPCV